MNSHPSFSAQLAQNPDLVNSRYPFSLSTAAADASTFGYSLRAGIYRSPFLMMVTASGEIVPRNMTSRASDANLNNLKSPILRTA